MSLKYLCPFFLHVYSILGQTEGKRKVFLLGGGGGGRGGAEGGRGRDRGMQRDNYTQEHLVVITY